MWKGPLNTDLCQDRVRAAGPLRWEGEMYDIGFCCLLFHFAPKVCWGPPNLSVLGGPKTRVCLGAPKGVNLPLQMILRCFHPIDNFLLCFVVLLCMKNVFRYNNLPLNSCTTMVCSFCFCARKKKMAKCCSIGYHQNTLLCKHIVAAIKTTNTITFCDITALPGIFQDT